MTRPSEKYFFPYESKSLKDMQQWKFITFHQSVQQTCIVSALPRGLRCGAVIGFETGGDEGQSGVCQGYLPHNHLPSPPALGLTCLLQSSDIGHQHFCVKHSNGDEGRVQNQTSLYPMIIYRQLTHFRLWLCLFLNTDQSTFFDLDQNTYDVRM